MADVTHSRIPTNCALVAFQVEEYTVASWTPLLDGQGKTTQVVIELIVKDFPAPLILRLKSRRAVETLLAALRWHANDVWPEGRDASYE